ncbi:MAG: hypothetical protein OHK0029_14840 [Armatimonadaceae bacterium]
MAHGHGGHGGFEFIHHSDPSNPFHIKHPDLKTYFLTYLALMFLLAVTVGLYFIDLSHLVPIPGINLIVALIVAVIKAGLVVTFFMNIKGGTRLIYLWALLGFIWLLLMGGIFMDYLTRQAVDQSGWQTLPYQQVVTPGAEAPGEEGAVKE